MASAALKPLYWVSSAKEDLRKFPDEVQREMGYALYLAQAGGKHPNAKPLRGFGSAGILEVIDDFDGSTFRTVYTAKLAGAIYALHAFQKKSRRGIATPKQEIELVRARLRRALEHYAALKRGRT
jgi:phage-related protein